MININDTKWEKLLASDVEAQLQRSETSENFYFEFKTSDISSSKLMKEVSAFANTFGGYIFIGVNDNKEISGMGDWTEQRIHSTIHDTISPCPIFHVKQFSINNQSILVIRIEEGLFPPYVVNDGRIYERVSSGSFPIKESAKLIQLQQKRMEQDKIISEAIEIEPIRDLSGKIDNIYAYIDIGVFITYRDILAIEDMTVFQKRISEKIKPIFDNTETKYSISIVGDRLIVTVGNAVAVDRQGNEKNIISGIQNFVEISNTGNIRCRILLLSEDNDNKANITIIHNLINIYKTIYRNIVGEELFQLFICAQKYEKLTVLQQFRPYYHMNTDTEESVVKKYEKLMNRQKNIYGGSIIVLGNRIPSSGFYTIDHEAFIDCEIEWNYDNLIYELFSTQYSNLGYVETINTYQKEDT